ncbi:MinD/ParA family protein [Microbacterium sp. 5K110]|uniref:MinD/ParA family ATP-binding protein n=1 Tax=unclassified Microbacterium TaxID=2609290 RepID=UPI00207BB2E9|nr:MinD/ParA family protein [Microbacterium sp. 5K110]
MTPDRTDETPDDDAEHGVLDHSGTLDTASISMLGGDIAQVSVDLPVTDDDEVDDDVVEDEMPVIDAESRAFEVVGIVHVPDVDGPPLLTHVPDPEVAATTHDPALEELPTGDIILEPHDDDVEADDIEIDVHDAEIVADGNGDADGDADPEPEVGEPEAFVEDELRDAESAAEADETEAEPEVVAVSVADAESEDEREVVAVSEADAESEDEREVVAEPEADAEFEDEPEVVAVSEADAEFEDEPEVVAEPVDGQGSESDDAVVEGETLADDAGGEDEQTDPEPVAAAAAPEVEADADDLAADEPQPGPADHVASAHVDAVTEQRETASTPDAPVTETVATVVAAGGESGSQTSDPATGPVPRTRAERAATGVIGTVPLTRREVQQADEAARSGRVHAAERVRTPGADVTLASKRLGEIDDTRESPDLLTADRLLDPRQISRPEPEGLWQQLVYSVSRHRINLGDGRRARARKDLDRRISAPLAGEPRFVPVLSRKGGVGKTTITSLLGMALADARDDRVIAVDANPDRGTLADRVGRANGRTVRDLVRAHDDVTGYGDVSSIVARDVTRLDVLASDSDPRVSEAFSDEDYRRVADVAAHYYSIVLTDTGTGIVHSVMEATLKLSDALVVVAGLSVDEARLASETLTWLETNGYADRVRNAVVVLNNARPGAPLVRESELEAHFRTRVRSVIRMPYDAHVAAGSAIAFRDLQPATRQAARELAAAVVEGLRTPAAAA